MVQTLRFRNLQPGQIEVVLLLHRVQVGDDTLDVPDQLAASVSWVKSLHSTIEAYTGKKLQISVLKFVFSEHDPVNSPYVDRDGKYLVKDHTVRHYTYAEANGAALKDLENTNIDVIR